MRRIKPDVVFSKGEAVSVPVIIAATKLPIIAPNPISHPVSPRRLARNSPRAYALHLRKQQSFKARHTGSPIRVSFMGSAEKARNSWASKGFAHTAHNWQLRRTSHNENIRAILPALLNEFNIAHICGKGKIDSKFEDLEGYKQFEYLSEPLKHVFAKPDIIVSRAGANAVFEFIALRKPALLIPLPSKSSRGDQLQNAMYFTKKGYFETLEQENITRVTLFDAIMSLYQNRERYIESMKKDNTLANGTQNVLNVILEAAKRN